MKKQDRPKKKSPNQDSFPPGTGPSVADGGKRREVAAKGGAPQEATHRGRRTARPLRRTGAPGRPASQAGGATGSIETMSSFAARNGVVLLRLLAGFADCLLLRFARSRRPPRPAHRARRAPRRTGLVRPRPTQGRAIRTRGLRALQSPLPVNRKATLVEAGQSMAPSWRRCAPTRIESARRRCPSAGGEPAV